MLRADPNGNIPTTSPTRENVLEHVRVVGKLSEDEKSKFKKLQQIHNELYREFILDNGIEFIQSLSFETYLIEKYGIKVIPFTLMYIDGFEIVNKNKYLMFFIKYPH